MIFGEVRFVLFVVGCWLTFFVVPVRWRPAVLAAWGVAFYATYATPFLLLVTALVLATYLIARLGYGLLMVAVLVALFVRFKLGFNGLAVGALQLDPAGAILIPLGFSFLAFELMHYAIDRRNGRIADGSLIDLAAFAFFFPCRIAGPIKRYPAFMEAVTSARPTVDNVYHGLVRVLIGMFKKVVLADLFALTVAEASYASTTGHAWRVMLAYSLEIYLDFSAYSDMAIGTSRMLGIAVPENFNWPYLSPNIQEFWNRWHMSLSSWARDYVFTPSGRALFKSGLRPWPSVIAAVSYLATFLVIGAWHGLTPNFLIWGGYQAILMIGYYIYRTRVPLAVVENRLFQSKLATAVSTLLTFVLVTIGWVPFMTDLPRSMQILRLMFGRS